MHGISSTLQTFSPTPAAGIERAKRLNPNLYAKTRNALDGDVSGLSPYLTHGLLSTAQVIDVVAQSHDIGFADKIVFELAWREFFQHVWSRAEPNACLDDMRPANLWAGEYARQMPLDVLEARTGVRAIDCAVRILYATGYLHNHARMWLASYCVHMRKVHWRAGADWMLAHLLDGDLPSNHLSWQWVAGTFSSKPYLFNADNASKFAPQGFADDWDSKGSVIDTDYADLDAISRSRGDMGPEPEDSPVWRVDLFAQATSNEDRATPVPPTFAQPLPEWGFGVPAFDAAQLDLAQVVSWVHPWDLADRAAGDLSHRVGVIHLPAHAAWPWSQRRWRFVLERFVSCVDVLFIGDLADLAAQLQGHGHLLATETLQPHYREALAAAAQNTTLQLKPAPRFFPNPTAACASFTRFYERVQREAASFQDLIDPT